ncbi:MAG: hypothetical protein ACRCZO_13195 [Cetobacterium sp.]
MKTHGGVREGAGRKPGINKIPKTIKIDKTLLDELEKINPDLKFIQKIESAIMLYIAKEKGE